MSQCRECSCGSGPIPRLLYNPPPPLPRELGCSLVGEGEVRRQSFQLWEEVRGKGEGKG